MKTIFKFILFLALLGCWACDGEQFLEDVKPSINQVSTEIESNITIDNLVRGAYFNLKSPGTFGPMDLLMYQDMQSDIVSFKDFSNATGGNWNAQPIYTRDREVNDIQLVEFPWAGAYTLLFNVNQVITFYDDNGPIEDENADWVPRLKGEAHFLRAFAYYLLATSYAPPYSAAPNASSVILRTKQSNAPTDFQGLATNEEVYSQIIADLKEAINLLPESFDGAVHPEDYMDRAKKDAARFLLAKTYFLMGEEYWNSGRDGDGGAMEQINAILGTNKYPLYNDGNLRDIFLKKGLGEQVDETVWYASYYFRNGWRTPRSGVYYSELTNKNRSFAVSKNTLNSIGWQDSTVAKMDKRYVNWFDRFDEGGTNEDPLFSGQYKDAYNVWCRKFSNKTSNFIVFRSPELYLMSATIKFKTGDSAGAKADLEVTRSRAGLDPLAEINMAEIEAEWFKEMGFEGRRLFLLQALKMDVPPGERSTGALPYNDETLYRELPRTELTRNPALSQ